MILVTGGTGHLGPELIPLLTARGLPVRVLTRDPARARNRLGNGAEFITGDARNTPHLARAVAGVESIVSAMCGFGLGEAGPQAVDGDGNLGLIRAAEAAGVRRFVLISMHGAAADHPLELLRMKWRAEQALRTSRLDWTIVRPTVFLELWAGIVGDPIATKGKATVYGRGTNPINFNSVKDVARFVELALVDPALSRTALDVGGPDNVTFNDLVQRIERATGRAAAVRHIPLPVMRLSSALMGPLKPDLARMIRAGVSMDTTDMSFDATELRRRFPQVQLTTVAEVIQARYGKVAAAAAR
jgi:NADH dehydrogenase